MFEKGFEVFESILSDAECGSFITALKLNDDNALRAGRRNLMSVSEVSALASDERLLSITRSLMGREMVPYKATLFNKTGKANWLVAWHQDTALPVEVSPDSSGWGPASVKSGVTFAHAPTWALRKILALRVHLDASSDENGPLRVIPSSHSERIFEDSELSYLLERTSSESVAVGRGGVIAMSPLLVHASSKCVSDNPRRVLHIEYAESMELAPGLKLAKA